MQGRTLSARTAAAAAFEGAAGLAKDAAGGRESNRLNVIQTMLNKTQAKREVHCIVVCILE